MRILLIAGHGAGDPGATAQIGENYLREADETRILVQNLFAELSSKYLVDVGIFSPDRNANADLKCGKLPKEVFEDYDYVLEIHFNAYKSSKADGHTKGVECYVTTSEKSVGVETLICQKVAALGLTNRGVKRKNYDVISAAKRNGVSSALLECCFIDDPDDVAVYSRNKKAMATAIAEGIALGFGLAKKPRSNREILQYTCGLADSTMEYLDRYRWSEDLYRKIVEKLAK